VWAAWVPWITPRHVHAKTVPTDLGSARGGEPPVLLWRRRGERGACFQTGNEATLAFTLPCAPDGDAHVILTVSNYCDPLK